MAQGRISTWRPLAVWLAVTGALTGAGATMPGAWVAARADSSATAVTDLLVAGCATALTAALGWLWLVTTVTVVELVAGGVAGTGGGATRRLVLVACGAAVVAGTSVPALAAGGEPRGPEMLVGLPLPERTAVGVDRAQPTRAPAPVSVRPAGAAADRYVVRPGDSLWSVAQAHPGTGGDTGQRWREIWHANRDVVGDDPDLILPGQELRLPDKHTDTDGAR